MTRSKASTWEKAKEMQEEIDTIREERDSMQDLLNALIFQNDGSLFIPHAEVLAAVRRPIIVRHVPAGIWIDAEGYERRSRGAITNRLLHATRLKRVQ